MPDKSAGAAFIDGGCVCGHVRYRALAKPLHSMICHCKSCRKAASAPLVPWVTFDRRTVQFTNAPQPYCSSEGVERGFCPQCGTPLTYSHRERPDELDLTTCSLDQPEAFPPKNDSWRQDDLCWMQEAAVKQRPGYSGFRPD